MSWFTQLYSQHPTVAPLITYMLMSAAIGAMPAPQSNSSLFYVWAFKFLNSFASNFSRAFSSKLGGMNGSQMQAGPVVDSVSAGSTK